MILLLLPLTLLLVSSSVPPAGQPIVALHAPAREPAGPPSFGLNSHLVTRYPQHSSMAVPAGAVQELGVSWVREDFHWHRIQPRPDVWDWSFPDAAMRELRQRNINVVGVLGPSVGWATPFPHDTPSDVSFYPPDVEHFVAYARAVATRYRQSIRYWEIWNEPDNPHFWKPTPDPAAYADLLIRTSAAIREVHPQAVILIGGFNPFNNAFVRAVAAHQGAWESFDIIAIHPYVDPYSPEEGNLVTAVDMVHTLNYELGDPAAPRPIWVTEIGWSSGPGDRDAIGLTDAEEQASFLVRSMLLLWEAGVERSFWYTLKDDPGNPYGLVALGNGRSDFASNLKKPAFAAFKTLNQQVANSRFVERRDLFQPATLVSFEDVAEWQRTSQPNGRLQATSQQSARLRYTFTTGGNDYVVFERREPLPLPDDTYAVGMWVYGDGTDHTLNVWLRDAEGEVLQFSPGIVGVPGWRFISAPIGIAVAEGNRIAGSGNGVLDMPASLVALTLDDARDHFIGSGTIYLDTITAIHGREVYDMRFVRGTQALDILWSPPGIRVQLNTAAQEARLLDRDGRTRQPVPSAHGTLLLDIPPEAPLYLWHAR
jgi:hypothetical protein